MITARRVHAAHADAWEAEGRARIRLYDQLGFTEVEGLQVRLVNAR